MGTRTRGCIQFIWFMKHGSALELEKVTRLRAFFAHVVGLKTHFLAQPDLINHIHSMRTNS